LIGRKLIQNTDEKVTPKVQMDEHSSHNPFQILSHQRHRWAGMQK